MTTFSRTWNATYESLPGDEDEALEGAGHIRNAKIDVQERMEVDHSWSGDTHDGKHNKVTFRAQAADPGLDAHDVALYGKAVGTKTELFFRNEDGNVTQMTFSGQSQTLPAGAIIPFGGTVEPGGFLFCHGQSLSIAQFPALFAVVGTTFGGDGVNNFFLPDLRGYVVAGKDNMGGVSANRLTSPLSGDTLGASGGSEGVALTQAQTPLKDHGHTVNDPGHVHNMLADSFSISIDDISMKTLKESFAADAGLMQSAVTGISINNTEDAAADSHTNVQPTFILNYIIKT